MAKRGAAPPIIVQNDHVARRIDLTPRTHGLVIRVEGDGTGKKAKGKRQRKRPQSAALFLFLWSPRSALFGAVDGGGRVLGRFAARAGGRVGAARGAGAAGGRFFFGRIHADLAFLRIGA